MQTASWRSWRQHEEEDVHAKCFMMHQFLLLGQIPVLQIHQTGYRGFATCESSETKQKKRGKKPDGRKLVEAWYLKKNDLNWRPGNNLVAIIQPVSAVINRRTKHLSSSLMPSSSFWCTQNTHSSLRNLRGGPQKTWRSPRVEESVMVVVFFLFPPKIAWSALFLNLDGEVKPQYNSHSYWKLALHKWHSSCNTTIAC